MKARAIAWVKSHPRLYFCGLRAWQAGVRASRKPILRPLCNLATGRRDYRVGFGRSIHEYCVEHGLPVEELRPNRDLTVYDAAAFRGAFSIHGARELACTVPSIYKTTLAGVDVIGEQDGFLIGVGDRNVHPEYLTDKFRLAYANGFNYVTGAVIERDGDACLVCARGHADKPIPEGIHLLGTAANNYGHFMFDILSRLAYVKQFRELDGVPLLLDWTVTAHPTCMELLRMVDEGAHPIIAIPRDRIRRIERLHYISPTSYSFPYSLPGSKVPQDHYAKDDLALSFLREKVLAASCDVSSPCGKRIVLVRGGDKVKRLVNEAEVSRVCEKHGFEACDPALYTIREQAAIFRDAEVVIGDYGAALSNVLYNRPGSTMVCIIPKSWGDCYFTTIARTFGVRCTDLDARLLGGGRLHKLDLDELEEFLGALDDGAI